MPSRITVPHKVIKLIDHKHMEAALLTTQWAPDGIKRLAETKAILIDFNPEAL